ncbi:MAG: aldose 1-epimerase [Fibrobacter sp.]|nr:aldose 1-epimerase [Fibrobacter sp.]
MSKFKIIAKNISDITCHAIVRDDGCEFEVFTGYGAGLNAWRVPAGSTKLDLLFGYREGDDVYKIGPDTNAGCRLCPWPGRTAYAKFTWEGKTYRLTNNVSWAPHALHGFLQNRPWQFQSFESDSSKAVAVFTCDWPGDFGGFPFPFHAENRVTFTGESYTVQSSVKNIGKAPMPYSEGWHPYYSMGEKIDGITMTLPPSEFSELDPADIPTGKTHPDTRFVKGRAIADEFINDCFCLDDKATDVSDGSAHVLLSGKHGNLTIWQRPGKNAYNAIQIYTPPDRMSIAIEPMTAAPDVLNHHKGLIVLAPGETASFEFGAKFLK